MVDKPLWGDGTFEFARWETPFQTPQMLRSWRSPGVAALSGTKTTSRSGPDASLFKSPFDTELSIILRVHESNADEPGYPNDPLYFVTFQDVSAFRVLDEGGLLEFWRQTESLGRSGGTAFRVRNRRWSRESLLAFLPGDEDGSSYVIATSRRVRGGSCARDISPGNRARKLEPSKAPQQARLRAAADPQRLLDRCGHISDSAHDSKADQLCATAAVAGRASAFAETGTAGVRALVAVIASLFLIPAVAWGKASEAQASVPAPPKCGSTTSKRFATEVLTRNPEFVRLSKLYERWSFRARAVIRIEGCVFQISGGHCVSEFGYGLDAVKIGLIATPPATSRSWLSIDLLPPPRAGSSTVKLGIKENSPPTSQHRTPRRPSEASRQGRT